VVINASKNPALTGISSSVCAARVVSTSGQTIPANTATKVQWDAAANFAQNITWDSANFRMIATNPGRYNVSASAYYVNALYTNNSTMYFMIYKNGLLHSRGWGPITQAINAIMSINITDTVSMVAGDYVEIFTFNERLGGTALSTTAGNNYFSISKVGGLG
jgi:hypothetical protein